MTDDPKPRRLTPAQIRAIFGDDLPAQTSDDRDLGRDDDNFGRDREQWIRDNIPPHHR